MNYINYNNDMKSMNYKSYMNYKTCMNYINYT